VGREGRWSRLEFVTLIFDQSSSTLVLILVLYGDRSICVNGWESERERARERVRAQVLGGFKCSSRV